MTELDREEILGERAEELAQRAERLTLREMVKAKEQRGDGGKRERTTTGTSREKEGGLAALKRRRQERGERKEKRPRREFDDDDDDEEAAPSPRKKRMPAEEDDDYTDDDGLPSSRATRAGRRREVERCGPSDLKDMLVRRDQLARFCLAPWFDDWVKGAWVRFCVGPNRDKGGQMAYRVCEVIGVERRDASRPEAFYKVEGTTTNVRLVLRFAKAERAFTMENISNGEFTSEEFVRLSKELRAASMELPTVDDAERKRVELNKHQSYTLTDSDLSRVLAQRQTRPVSAQARIRFQMELDAARMSGNEAEITRLEALLANASPAKRPSMDYSASSEQMAKISERNRAANRDEVKRAEVKGQEDKRRTAEAPGGLARSRSRVMLDRSGTPSRPGTPLNNGTSANNGTPGVSRGQSPTPQVSPSKKAGGLEDLAKGVKVDLGMDF